MPAAEVVEDWGRTQIVVSNCVPGATLKVFDVSASDPILLGFPSSGTTTLIFSGNLLSGVSAVMVEQELCGQASGPSNAVNVATLEGSADVVVAFWTPVMVCASVVRITGTLPAGTTVLVYSEKWSGKVPAPGDSPWIGAAYVEKDGDHVDVQLLSPVAGDTLYVFGLRCGQVFGPATTVVQPLPASGPIPTPTVVASDSGGARASNIVPGARVDFYVDGVFYKTVSTPITSTPLVTLPRTTVAGTTTVKARQRICSVMTESSAVVVALGNVSLLDEVNVCAGRTDGALEEIADLGVSVDHNGTLFMFFGDAGNDCGNHICPKPVFQISGAPDPCTLQLSSPLCSTDDIGAKYHRLDATVGPFDSYEEPTGAFSYDGTLHLFVTKRFPGILSGNGQCPPGAMARSVLTKTSPGKAGGFRCVSRWKRL